VGQILTSFEQETSSVLPFALNKWKVFNLLRSIEKKFFKVHAGIYVL
jgi:hypothetical protein